MVAIFLFLIANDRQIIDVQYTNGWFSNIWTLLIVGLSCFLGLNNLVKAFASGLGFTPGNAYYPYIGGLSLLVVLFLFWSVFLKKASDVRAD
jgi:hypothetical protein